MNSKDLCKLDNGLSKTQHIGYQSLIRPLVRFTYRSSYGEHKWYPRVGTY